MAVHHSPKANYAGSIPAAYAIFMEVKLQWTGIRLLIELFVWVQLPRLPPISVRRGC